MQLGLSGLYIAQNIMAVDMGGQVAEKNEVVGSKGKIFL